MKQYQSGYFSKSALLVGAFFIISLLGIGIKVVAQQAVQIGKGSYAEYPPLSKSWTSEHNGDKSRIMQTKELFIKEDGNPIPTNDWWTDVLNTRYSGNLWAYPQIVNAEDYGIYIAYPTSWSSDGCEMKWNSQLEIMGNKFYPESAVAENWHDWGLEMKLAQGEKEMKVTLAHGIPFTWMETKNIIPQFRVKDVRFFSASGEISLPVTTNRLVLMLGEDAYGVYVPDGTQFEKKGDVVSIQFKSSKQFISVAVLPQKEDLEAFAAYAYVIPRSTEVKWNYNETTGKVASTWNIATENLNGGSERNVLQGFIPHHYKRSEMSFGFTDYTYVTPRGEMKMAAGNTFTVTYDFKGILPYYAAPKEMQNLKSPYNRERMKQMISEYADRGSFGGDTYWGGKGLTQMALYMTFAHEMGETELFEKCRQRLKDVMVNWLTYTPGENNFFFARYQRWGALIGYDTSYDSDTFNDHHFHYGYYTYAGALLALLDDDFRKDYGQMLTLVAKDYANWDKSDKDFPFFRTFDPWAGHSYAGGLGGWNGNGQESTSEAMQGWGGMYLLGVATENKEMRDAAIFGWTTESRGVAEYWFDRDNENINRELYTRPYNSNLTSQGIGWWTWFSGDPVWMHSIQWMPISPCLKYLSENLDFARHDYAQMWEKKEIGGWDNENAKGESLAKESGLGNVVLSYLQRFDPDSAANVFDKLWNDGKPTAKNPDTGGISYYILHSHRTYGDIDWEIHADVPTATTYKDKAGVYTYVVYNPESSERTVTFYRGNTVEKKIKAPAGKLTVYSAVPYVAAIEIVKPASLIVPVGQKLQLSARITDQYGAVKEGALTWKANNNNGSISQQGLFTAGNNKGTTCTVTADLGEVSAKLELTINDKAVLSRAEIQPRQPYLEVGKSLNFSLKAEDQYGNTYPAKAQWKILKDDQVVKTDSIFDLQTVGIYTIQVLAEGNTYSERIYLSPKLVNIALNKKVTSNSEENVGTLTKYATDGDKATRWGSKHEDNQWIYVDLGEKSYLSHVSMVWDPSYASLYEIQVSDDGILWDTVKRVTGLGGTEAVDLNCGARYVKMNGLKRGSVYGFSLYEFEVYGVPASLNDQDILGIQITAPSMLMKEGESVQLQATAYNAKGKVVPTQISWKVNGEGTIANGLFTPQRYGNVTVEATANGKKAEITFIVEENIKLTSVSITPGSAVLIVGDSQDFDVVFQDQFGCSIPLKGLEHEIIGTGKATFINNRFTATTAGDYKLIVGRGKVVETVNIKVAAIEEVNLALNKSARASGSEGENSPSNVNDGNMSTRWSSSFEDGVYLQIDLERDYVINCCKIFWEDSYATAYRIDVSLDEDNWTTVFEESSGRGGDENIKFSEVAARYVRLVCLKRSSMYGSSLWEFEIYGTEKWTNPVPTEIRIIPQPLAFYCEEETPLEVVILDQYGIALQLSEPIVYTPSGGGSIVKGRNFLAMTSGEYALRVAYGDLQKEFPFTVYPKKVLSRLTIEPDGYKLKVGESLQLIAKGLDQYGNSYPVEPTWNSSEEGIISSSGVFKADRPGAYSVSATTLGMMATLIIEVINVDNVNIVLNKPTETSTALSPGMGAVDNNAGTRWESTHQEGPEWIQVDMEIAYLVTDVEIDWEKASAADYEIQISIDGENWKTLQKVFDQSDARTDELRVNGVGRYLRIYCTRRSTVWGYSILEMRAYGEKMKAGEPYTINLVNSMEILTVGETKTFIAEVKDMKEQLVLDYPLNWSITGGGTIDAKGTFFPILAGDYRLDISCKLAKLSVLISVNADPVGIDDGKDKSAVVREGNKLKVLGSDVESISLFDMQGRLVVYDEDKQIIETDNLRGIYLLMVKKHFDYEVFKVVM